MKKVGIGLALTAIIAGLVWWQRVPVGLWLLSHGYGRFLRIKPPADAPPSVVYEVSREIQVKLPAAAVSGAAANLGSALQSARAVPYLSQEGRFAGFHITRLEPDSLFAKAGIQSGDIIRSVNEVVLDNPGKGLEAFQSLRTSNVAKVVVSRGADNIRLVIALE